MEILIENTFQDILTITDAPNLEYQHEKTFQCDRCGTCSTQPISPLLEDKYVLTECKGLVCQICFPECRFGIKCPLCGSKDCQCHKFGTDEQVKLLEANEDTFDYLNLDDDQAQFKENDLLDDLLEIMTHHVQPDAESGIDSSQSQQGIFSNSSQPQHSLDYTSLDSEIPEPNMDKFKEGDNCQVLDRGHWYDAKIIERANSEMEGYWIHYKMYNSRHDQIKFINHIRTCIQFNL